jgi:hypothetical protein
MAAVKALIKNLIVTDRRQRAARLSLPHEI